MWSQVVATGVKAGGVSGVSQLPVGHSAAQEGETWRVCLNGYSDVAIHLGRGRVEASAVTDGAIITRFAFRAGHSEFTQGHWSKGRAVPASQLGR